MPIVSCSRFQRALLALSVLVSAPVLADPPPWAGGGKHGDRQEQRYDERRDERRDDYREEHRDDRRHGSGDFRFDDGHRRIVNDYYGHEFHSGHCPPGLAKKHNGCMPPGQERKWGMGRPLPRDVRYYELPRELTLRLPPPPANQRYVRVASDILLIAVGTNLVIDAIQDIGR